MSDEPFYSDSQLLSSSASGMLHGSDQPSCKWSRMTTSVRVNWLNGIKRRCHGRSRAAAPAMSAPNYKAIVKSGA